MSGLVAENVSLAKGAICQGLDEFSKGRGARQRIARLRDALTALAPGYAGLTEVFDRNLLARITSNPEIFGGKPIIRGMRISVELVLSLLAQGVTTEDILSDYPSLTREDVQACLAYARAVIANDTLDAVRIGE